MPIDTSSYYPEVNDPNSDDNNKSLNGSHSSLFGDYKNTDTQESGKDFIVEIETNDNDAPDPIKTEESGLERGISIFSNFLSWILVPLLMPVYGIIFIFRLSVLDVVSPGMQTAFTLIIAGINLCIPILLILLLKFLGIVEDVGLNGQRERSIPYVITAICLGVSAWFVTSRGAPIWMSMFFAGGAVAALINLVVNFRWKISAHAAGIAGVIALLIRLEKDVAAEPHIFVWLLITVGAAGLLGSARVWLGRHTVWQVVAGYIVGFCSVFFMMAIH